MIKIGELSACGCHLKTGHEIRSHQRAIINRERRGADRALGKSDVQRLWRGGGKESNSPVQKWQNTVA